MPKLNLFKAKVIASNGTQVLILAAESEAEALLVAERAGRVVFCKKHYNFWDYRKLSSEEREQFLSQLSFLTSSGVGTGEALRVLQANHAGRVEALAGELLTQIESGLDLSSALSAAGARDFPPAILALIAAGYRSGEGPDSLKAAAQFESDMRALLAESGADLFAAGSGFAAAVICTGFSVFYLGPQVINSELAKVAGTGVDVAWAMTAGYGLVGFLGICLLFLLSLGINQVVIRPKFPEFADRLSQKLPFWRDLALAKERFLAFFSLQALASPNISLEKAFEITANGTTPGLLRTEFKAAQAAIQRGGSWVGQLTSLNPIDKAALNVAGDRKQLATIFGNLAMLYKARYAKAKRLTASVLKLISALALTVAGGLLFALTILPMLQAVNSILT